MKEEDLLKMIKNSADDVNIPDRLKPENMMKTLQEMDQETVFSEDEWEDEPKSKSTAESADESGAGAGSKRLRFRPWQYGTVAAAALVAVSLIAVNQGQVATSHPAQTEIWSETGVTEAAKAMEEQETAGEVLGEAAAEAEHQYLAASHDQIYDRFQLLWNEQDEYYRSMVTTEDIIVSETMAGEADGSASTGSGASANSGTSGGSAPSAVPAPVAGAAKEEASYDIMESADEGAGLDREPSYSGTNVQVEGIDEGDVVKTDGTYIYIASRDYGTIRIIRADGEKLEKVGEIADTSTVDSSRRINEFYLNGDLMTVIRSSYEQSESKERVEPARETAPQADIAYYYGYMPGKAVTRIETYDLSDPKMPKLTGTVVQDGYYRNSRRNGDYVYAFSCYDSNIHVDRSDVEAYVPTINGKVLPADCIYMPEEIDSYSYLVVSAIDMREPEKPVQSKAVAASGEQYYVSSDHIYVASSKYDFRANQYNYTELMKLSYRDGRITFKAHGNINGYLNNQFSMDEYQGNLRLVSTLSRNNGKDTNSLYVLDEKLEKIGEIKNLAPDEQIYSARFMGDIGYFVTFRNMDPLFSVDLSDPKNPKILGELKITGFSEYLHPYLDGLLLGIGREIDPDSGNYEGLKLSMFDTTDPKNVKEVQKMVEEKYENSPAWHNHKAVLISPTRNLIGFTADSYDYDKRDWSIVYTVYSYDKEQGFKQELSTELDHNGDYSMARGLYIDDCLYVVENNQIHAFDLNDFKQIGDLKFSDR